MINLFLDNTEIPDNQEKFKQWLIERLNKSHDGWVNGDEKDLTKRYKADVVNHRLKIAIEIKDDIKHRIELPKKTGVIVIESVDLKKMNERLNDMMRSASRKFKWYPNYKTILLLRTQYPLIDDICYALDGLYAFKSNKNGRLKYIGRISKYSTHIRKRIGSFLVFSDDFYYFPNQWANPNRVLTKEEIERLFKLKFKNVFN